MDISLLRHYVTVADKLDLAAAATELGVSHATLSGSLNQVEALVGAHLVNRATNTMSLTEAGALFLVTAHDEIAAYEAANKPVVPKAGGKAKANKGKGRAPRVKGEPLPYKKRQSR